MQTDVIETGPIFALQDPTEKMRPARPGISIGHYQITAGTLGCLVQRDGQVYILSNNHVLAKVNSLALGTSILQPSIPDGGRKGEDEVAELLRVVPIEFDGLPNLVDAAIAKLVPAGREQDRAGIFDCGEPSRQVKSLQSEPNPVLLPGMDVFKTGRSTCHTAGRIRAINVNNYLVDIGFGVARFEDRNERTGKTESTIAAMLQEFLPKSVDVWSYVTSGEWEAKSDTSGEWRAKSEASGEWGVKSDGEEVVETRLGIDAFNVFNQVSYRNFIGTLTSPFFGRANSAHDARELQLSLRIKF